MTFPSYRHRYLPAMTARQIAAIPNKATTPVILATGAIEQHGPHLPVAVDALMGQAWLSLALARLGPTVPVYVAPAVTIGKSNEHTGFPGTLMITKATLRTLILTVAQQVHRWGFRHLAVINTHGGNLPILIPTLREIRAGLDMRADMLRFKSEWELSPQEATFGIHAGEIETSWLLAAMPDWVDASAAVCEYPALISDPGRVRPVAAPATVAWASRDVAKTGTLGDATAGTAEKGQRWLELGARNLADAIAQCCRAAQAEAQGR